jgi:hypothetical protein
MNELTKVVVTLIASASVGTIVEDAAKAAFPAAAKPITGFFVNRVAPQVIGGAIGGFVSAYVVGLVSDIVDTVKSVGSEEPIEED